ncbi:MAG: hypothetical protein AB7P14_25135 [Blastocatellales bacterium]
MKLQIGIIVAIVVMVWRLHKLALGKKTADVVISRHPQRFPSIVFDSIATGEASNGGF